MKTVLIYVFFLFPAFAQGQTTSKLLPLMEHNNTPSAGCFIRGKGGVYCQLNPLDGEYYFNLKGFEEKFQKIEDKKLYPKGYNYGFQNKDTLIFIKEVLEKKVNQSYQTYKYEIVIRIGKKEHRQILQGFCGS
jgi:hypothetical protein